MQAVQTVRGGGSASFAPLFGGGSADGAYGRQAAAQAEQKQQVLTDLSMYDTPPAENITLEEFERLALARLSGASVRAGMGRRWGAGREAQGGWWACPACKPISAAASPSRWMRLRLPQVRVRGAAGSEGELATAHTRCRYCRCSVSAVLKELEAFKLRHPNRGDTELLVRAEGANQ